MIQETIDERGASAWHHQCTPQIQQKSSSFRSPHQKPILCCSPKITTKGPKPFTQPSAFELYMATLDQDSKTLLATSSDCSPTPESPVTPISAARLNSISVLHSTIDASVDPEPALVILSCPNTKNKLTSIDSPDDIGPTLSASLVAPPVCHTPDTVQPIIPTSSSFTSDKLLNSAVAAPIFPTTYPFPIHPFLEDGITPNTDGYRPYPEIFRKYPTKKISPAINISNRVRKFLSVKNLPTVYLPSRIVGTKRVQRAIAVPERLADGLVEYVSENRIQQKVLMSASASVSVTTQESSVDAAIQNKPDTQQNEVIRSSKPILHSTPTRNENTNQDSDSANATTDTPWPDILRHHYPLYKNSILLASKVHLFLKLNHLPSVTKQCITRKAKARVIPTTLHDAFIEYLNKSGCELSGFDDDGERGESQKRKRVEIVANGTGKRTSPEQKEYDARLAGYSFNELVEIACARVEEMRPQFQDKDDMMYTRDGHSLTYYEALSLWIIQDVHPQFKECPPQDRVTVDVKVRDYLKTELGSFYTECLIPSSGPAMRLCVPEFLVVQFREWVVASL